MNQFAPKTVRYVHLRAVSCAKIRLQPYGKRHNLKPQPYEKPIPNGKRIVSVCA